LDADVQSPEKSSYGEKQNLPSMKNWKCFGISRATFIFQKSNYLVDNY
jgi:hypothetical protein